MVIYIWGFLLYPLIPPDTLPLWPILPVTRDIFLDLRFFVQESGEKVKGEILTSDFRVSSLLQRPAGYHATRCKHETLLRFWSAKALFSFISIFLRFYFYFFQVFSIYNLLLVMHHLFFFPKSLHGWNGLMEELRHSTFKNLESKDILWKLFA